jgi:methylated-DNA-protein-cysteine methyltransferase-like protein
MFKRLLTVVRRIPRGRVCTYGGVARLAGYPGASRQVVWALHSASANGLPWHRVLGAGGRILLAGESALEQRFRLEAEGVEFRGNRANMEKHEWPNPQTKHRKRKVKSSPRHTR